MSECVSTLDDERIGPFPTILLQESPDQGQDGQSFDAGNFADMGDCAMTSGESGGIEGAQASGVSVGEGGSMSAGTGNAASCSGVGM